ncbi:MAG: hypothetical protein ACPLKQ_05490 [Candidatus Bathyarchaeales archaeon]
MKYKWLAIIALILLISLSIFVANELCNDKRRTTPKVFVGVEYAYGDVGGVNDCKALVDRVKGYTNLFVVGLAGITFNRTALNEACSYIYDAGLYFIVQLTAPIKYSYTIEDWVVETKEKYGDKFLGVYYFDEPGGRQLDDEESRFVLEAENYTDAAENYVYYLYVHLDSYLRLDVSLFTADYGLYWFNYKAGYDAVFTEFGWNHSRELHVAMCRGAAKAQNKDWGAIITWTYNGTPYIEPGDKLYKDMELAYHAGAKYIIVFNYPKIGPYGILTDEHFLALENFWNYINTHPEKHGIEEGKVAYILPENYGFGFRNSNDTIWGLWEADQLSKKISEDVNNLLKIYRFRLDIVYNDQEFNSAIKSKYDELIFWNKTRI